METDKKAQNPEQDKSPSKENIPVIASDEEGDVQNNQRHPNQREDKSRNEKNISSIIINVGTIIINTTLAIFTFLLWQEASIQTKSSKDASVAAIKAANAAEESIALSQQIADTSKKFTKIGLRAYLVIKDIVPTQLVSEKPVRAKEISIIKGNTPAYNVKVAMSFKFGGSGFYEKEFRKFLIDAKYKIPVISVDGVNLESEFEGNFVLTKEKLSQIKQGKRLWFAVVNVIYDDVFGERHYTSGCYRYNAEDNKFYYYGDYSRAN